MTANVPSLLPQGTSIVTSLEPEHQYLLEPGRTLCFPFKMRRHYNQLVIDMADITPVQSCFMLSIRAWPSTAPAGISMTAEPRQTQGTVILPPSGVKWNFFLIDLVDAPSLQESDISRWIDPSTTYYMNVQNLVNRTNYFWCRFTFHGVGITHVE